VVIAVVTDEDLFKASSQYMESGVDFLVQDDALNRIPAHLGLYWRILDKKF